MVAQLLQVEECRYGIFLRHQEEMRLSRGSATLVPSSDLVDAAVAVCLPGQSARAYSRRRRQLHTFLVRRAASLVGVDVRDDVGQRPGGVWTGRGSVSVGSSCLQLALLAAFAWLPLLQPCLVQVGNASVAEKGVSPSAGCRRSVWIAFRAVAARVRDVCYSSRVVGQQRRRSSRRSGCFGGRSLVSSRQRAPLYRHKRGHQRNFSSTCRVWSQDSRISRNIDSSVLRDFGTTVGKFGNKCLQGAVLSLCNDVRERLRMYLTMIRQCSNHAGSSLCHGGCEK